MPSSWGRSYPQLMRAGFRQRVCAIRRGRLHTLIRQDTTRGNRGSLWRVSEVLLVPVLVKDLAGRCFAHPARNARTISRRRGRLPYISR